MVPLTIAGDVLDKDLHGRLWLGRRGAGGDWRKRRHGGDAVGTHVGEVDGCVYGGRVMYESDREEPSPVIVSRESAAVDLAKCDKR